MLRPACLHGRDFSVRKRGAGQSGGGVSSGGVQVGLISRRQSRSRIGSQLWCKIGLRPSQREGSLLARCRDEERPAY